MARGRGQGRPQRGGGSFRGRRTAGAPHSGGALGARPSSHIIAKSFNRTNTLPWQKSLTEGGLRAAALSSGLDIGSKLFVSNLDVQVSNDDIRELFSEMGELIRYAIHFDKYGRTSGSAEVVFARRNDALKALKKYNNVMLDGRPMKIEFVGNKLEFPLSAHLNVAGNANGSKSVMKQPRRPTWARGGGNASTLQGSGFNQRGSGGFRNMRGQRRARGGGQKKHVLRYTEDFS
ncbi:hypothetical protein DM860_016265 [Cuscuta australis]|uniref:RRM domain-containing protein n=1 Tax=Cuscuta australis TaxID=267555 RepID=A0A328E664_9ASTE|nr:hypothetical protein DM860_016265 [Cuscuta australis]